MNTINIVSVQAKVRAKTKASFLWLLLDVSALFCGFGSFFFFLKKNVGLVYAA